MEFLLQRLNFSNVPMGEEMVVIKNGGGGRKCPCSSLGSGIYRRGRIRDRLCLSYGVTIDRWIDREGRHLVEDAIW